MLLPPHGGRKYGMFVDACCYCRNVPDSEAGTAALVRFEYSTILDLTTYLRLKVTCMHA